jgi:hypothetical protein
MSIIRQTKVRPISSKASHNRKSHVITNTVGEYNDKVPSYERKLTFVTLEDVFPGQFEQNYVIYNPMLTKEENERILKHAHMHTFEHTPITDDDVDALTVYDKDHLDDFIEAYKKILNFD